MASLAAAIALTACAAVPDSGSVQAGKVAVAAGGQGRDFLQLIPAAPGPSWSPQTVVAGFLAANASFAGHYASARQYLTPEAARSWSPGREVTVFAGPPSFAVQTLHQPGNNAELVEVTLQALATLTKDGQYVGNQHAVPYTAAFQLARINGQWRISNPPSRLLLAAQDFQRVYQPSNLYFVAGRALVPDPVFEPVQATSADLAYRLANALLANPQGWLKGAAATAFPRGVRGAQVAIEGGTAVVDLTGRLAHVSRTDVGEMTSQLSWTLAGPSYGQSAIQSVRLEIDGRQRAWASWSGGQPRQAARPKLSVPAQPPGAPLYSVAADGAVQELGSSAPVPGEAGSGRVQLAQIAVSPDGRHVAGTSRSGTSLYYGAIGSGAVLARWSQAAGFTSLSWDPGDRLFAAGPSGVWMLAAGSRPSAVAVSVPAGYHVAQFVVAPDGVRVAMIIQQARGGNAELKLGAISRNGGRASVRTLVSIGTDVTDPTDLTWYDADWLIVLSQSASNPQLQEVPVNGGPSTPIVAQPHTLTITADGPDNPLVAGLPGGQLALGPTIDADWTVRKGAGAAPAYAG